MTKKYVLYPDGRLFYDHLCQHGLDGVAIHKVKATSCYGMTRRFLIDMGLKRTVYNVGCLQMYGKIVLPEPIAKQLIAKGVVKVIE